MLVYQRVIGVPIMDCDNPPYWMVKLYQPTGGFEHCFPQILSSTDSWAKSSFPIVDSSDTSDLSRRNHN